MCRRSWWTSMIQVVILDHGQGFGGTVVVAATLMRHLDASRFRVTLVTAADLDFVSAQVGCAGEIISLKPRFSYVEASRLRQAVLRGKRTFFRRFANRLAFTAFSLLNAGYVLRLLLLVRRRRFSLIHCNNFDNFEGMLPAWLFGVPCLLHAHGLVSRAGLLSRWLEGRLEPPVVAISKVVGDTVRTSGVPQERIHVLYNPAEHPRDASSVDPEPGELFRKDLDIPNDAVLVGIVGRVVSWKGQREFVLACLQAFPRVPDLHAVVVGSGADFDDGYLESVKKLARASSYAERIHFTGFLQDTSSVYAALDVLVHASIEPEPFGLVITEAMVHGVPVIAASSGAPVEFIKENETGFLRDPTDPVALSNSITELALDPGLRARIGLAGRQSAFLAFDCGAYAREFERLYDAALESQAEARHASV